MGYRYKSSRHRGKNNNRRRSSGGGKGQYINPQKFIKVATGATQEEYIPEHTFVDFPLDERIQANLRHKGFTTPTPIQDQAMIPALQGKDVIGVASTGTGKTTAFALPILQKLIMDPNSSALIVAPTRELAQQIDAEIRTLSAGLKLHISVLIGGVRMGGQIHSLKRHPRIIIGTPGRIKDHIQRRTLRLSFYNTVVLDEVDRMLDMGFVKDVTDILGEMNVQRQSLFFSATMDARVQNIVQQFTEDPVEISLKQADTSDNVHQDVVNYRGNMEKIDKLHEILITTEVTKVIIFDETKRGVEKLSNELVSRGFSADALHGGKSQGQRSRALGKFKDNKVNILVATDVAARGLDVSDITHVINYSIPRAYDDYIHRVGRAGRAGKIGYALTFVNTH